MLNTFEMEFVDNLKWKLQEVKDQQIGYRKNIDDFSKKLDILRTQERQIRETLLRYDEDDAAFED